ncbi:MAG TPA: hypothetical protein VFZ38_22200 [Vicinamibacterales bacterium]
MTGQDATRARAAAPNQAGSKKLYLPPPARFYIVGALRTALTYSKPFWLGASAVTAVMIVFGTVNFGPKQQQKQHLQQQASLVPIASVAQTVIHRAADRRQSFQDRWEQARVFFSEAESEELQAEDQSETTPQTAQAAQPVQTVRAKNPLPREIVRAEANIGALAFAPPTGPATFTLASASSEPVSRETAAAGTFTLASVSSEAVSTETTGSIREIPVGPEARNLGKLDEVERYLWEVYQRAPVKKDGSGDFTWKDPVAAKRFGISMPAYVISGMDPDFREQLYHAGKAMDAAGIRWAILSAFRDDYRQSLASGFKASARNSLHGGSARVGGYGHGRAVDVTGEDNNPTPIWKWLDAHGAKYGLHRPMPGNDPAHVQSRGDWRKLAQALRASRTQIAETKAAKAKAKVATAAAAR